LVEQEWRQKEWRGRVKDKRQLCKAGKNKALVGLALLPCPLSQTRRSESPARVVGSRPQPLCDHLDNLLRLRVEQALAMLAHPNQHNERSTTVPKLLQFQRPAAMRNRSPTQRRASRAPTGQVHIHPSRSRSVQEEVLPQGRTKADVGGTSSPVHPSRLLLSSLPNPLMPMMNVK
jgi:hypothetical protein